MRSWKYLGNLGLKLFLCSAALIAGLLGVPEHPWNLGVQKKTYNLSLRAPQDLKSFLWRWFVVWIPNMEADVKLWLKSWSLGNHRGLRSLWSAQLGCILKEAGSWIRKFSKKSSTFLRQCSISSQEAPYSKRKMLFGPRFSSWSRTVHCISQ